MSIGIHTSLSSDQLGNLAVAQVNTSFPDGQIVSLSDLMPAVGGALARLQHSFTHVRNKYFFDGTKAIFDHLHGDQYAMWLYFLSSELFRIGGPEHACKKLFLLNKMLHGCDIFYEVELPSVFLLVHPLGTVLGRGRYDDFFIAYQRCGIGSNHDVYPVLGKHITMSPGSAILGNSTVGENCTIAAESLLLDQSLSANSVYIGNPRDHMIRPKINKEIIWRI